jgi:hypothetical protein
MSSLDGKGDHSDMFALDDYGKSLQPPMTKELEERISKSVSKGEPYTELKM